MSEKSQEVLKKITMEKTLDLSTGYPINTVGRYLKNKFGCKVAKLALDRRFTCPNRDGSTSNKPGINPAAIMLTSFKKRFLSFLYSLKGHAAPVNFQVHGAIRLAFRHGKRNVYNNFFRPVRF